MKPPIIPSYAIAYQDLGTTIGRLFSAFAGAVNEAREYFELKEERDRSFFSHHVRYLAKVELKNDSYQAEDVDLEETANSGICVVLSTYRLRVLRAAEDGQIPDPGDSVRRKRFLAQESEQMSLFEDTQPPADSLNEATEPTHIVLLWEVDSKNQFTGFWFICPNGTAEPYFRVWLPLPEATGLGAPPEAIEPETPPQAPENIGFTKKVSDKTEAPPKTGTESEE